MYLITYNYKIKLISIVYVSNNNSKKRKIVRGSSPTYSSMLIWSKLVFISKYIHNTDNLWKLDLGPLKIYKLLSSQAHWPMAPPSSYTGSLIKLIILDQFFLKSISFNLFIKLNLLEYWEAKIKGSLSPSLYDREMTKKKNLSPCQESCLLWQFWDLKDGLKFIIFFVDFKSISCATQSMDHATVTRFLSFTSIFKCLFLLVKEFFNF